MQLLSSQDVNWCTGVVWVACGLLWCFYQLFGLWRHPFTTEDPLVSKWCNATFLQICSHEETKSSTSWMAWGWVNSQLFKIFWGNYSFKWVEDASCCIKQIWHNTGRKVINVLLLIFRQNVINAGISTQETFKQKHRRRTNQQICQKLHSHQRLLTE